MKNSNSCTKHRHQSYPRKNKKSLSRSFVVDDFFKLLVFLFADHFFSSLASFSFFLLVHDLSRFVYNSHICRLVHIAHSTLYHRLGIFSSSMLNAFRIRCFAESIFSRALHNAPLIKLRTASVSTR